MVAAVITLVVYLWRRDRMQKREDMGQYFANAEQYIAANNFLRAKEECAKALEQAQKLRDKEAVDKYNACLMSLEAVIGADDLYNGGDYTGAKDAYIKAEEQARYADNAGLEYIEGKLHQINEYEQVFDSIELGDSLFEHDNYEQAEQKYLEAKAKAASIYFNDGKQQALDALEKLYEEWSAVKEEEEKQKKEQEKLNEEQAVKLAADQAAAAELVRQGEEAFSQGDLDGANVYYLIAMEKYAALEDTAQIEIIQFLPTKFYPAKDSSGYDILPLEEADMMIGQEITIKEDFFNTYDNNRRPNSWIADRLEDGFWIAEMKIEQPEYCVERKYRKDIYGLRDNMLPNQITQQEYIEIDVYPGYYAGDNTLPQLFVTENRKIIMYAMGNIFC